MAAAIVASISRLAGLGDGVAETEAGRLHVPLTAPGDLVRISPAGKDRAELLEVLEPGGSRVSPACIHFGACGGCALQHLAPEFVAGWKRELVVAALLREGLDGSIVGPVISIPAGTRRRATLSAKRLANRVVLGFSERRSHALVDISECPLLVPELTAIIPRLRQVLGEVLERGEAADIALAATEPGIDLMLVRPRKLTLPDRERLAAFAEGCDLARLSWRASPTRDAEPVATRRTPAVRLGVHQIALPPGGFLQPSAEGEVHLVKLVREALADAPGPFVDLFAGAGTFALPLSAAGKVTAFDAEKDAVAALNAARNPAVAAHRRDLFREPLTPLELNAFGAAVLDPPRAGAAAQSQALALSKIARIAYVSCNLATFARDAAILTGGGHWLVSATPVDQFVWSPHVELVGMFARSEG